MITALMILVLLLTGLLAVSLPWTGWGSGMDAAGRGMAMFFPIMFMGARFILLVIAIIVLAAGGGLDWTGLPAAVAAILAIAMMGGMAWSSFTGIDLMNRGPRAEGRARLAFLAAIAAPLTLVIWIFVERYGPTEPPQAWAMRALVLIMALAPVPLIVRVERQIDEDRRVQDDEEARLDAEADARASVLPAGASLAETLRFLDALGLDDWRARGRVMARAEAMPDAKAQLATMLSGDWADKIAAGFHATALSPATDTAYYAAVQPLIAEIVRRLQTNAATSDVLLREANAALRLAWPAIHTTALPRALMQALYDAVLARSDDVHFSNLQHDVKMLAEMVNG